MSWLAYPRSYYYIELLGLSGLAAGRLRWDQSRSNSIRVSQHAMFLRKRADSRIVSRSAQSLTLLCFHCWSRFIGWSAKIAKPAADGTIRDDQCLHTCNFPATMWFQRYTNIIRTPRFDDHELTLCCNQAAAVQKMTDMFVEKCRTAYEADRPPQSTNNL